ncbi:hypothetical protein C8J56DRAFT_903668 [Mycena floridula]|nr:hypothetical protein C8J56DRAFT_903668 [Mycena floridula]
MAGSRCCYALLSSGTAYYEIATDLVVSAVRTSLEVGFVRRPSECRRLLPVASNIVRDDVIRLHRLSGAWFRQATEGIAKATASRLQYPQMLYKMLHSPDGQGNALLLPGERRRKAVKQGSAVFDRQQISTTPDDPNRPIASRGYYSTIVRYSNAFAGALIYGREATPKEISADKNKYTDPRENRMEKRICGRPEIYRGAFHFQSSSSQPRSAQDFFCGCTHDRLFTIALLLSPLAGLLDTRLFVRSLKRYYHVVVEHNPDNPDTAMSSWRRIRWSLCHGDKLVIRIFEFVLYDSSPQLTNTGFLIGDIVVRILMAIHPLVSLIRLISELRTSSQEYPATSPASPSPFGTAIVTIRYVTNPHFRVDEKEGVSSRFWREERDGRGDGRDGRDGRERRDNPSSSLSSPPFAKFEFDYHSKLGLRDPSENSRPGRGASTYET